MMNDSNTNSLFCLFRLQEIYLAIYWLAMSNAMYNPMIYCFMNNRWVSKPRKLSK